MTDVDDYDDWDDSPEPSEPPDWCLERDAAEELARHITEVHGGGVCDCPAPELPAEGDGDGPWDEAPF